MLRTLPISLVLSNLKVLFPAKQRGCVQLGSGRRGNERKKRYLQNNKVKDENNVLWSGVGEKENSGEKKKVSRDKYMLYIINTGHMFSALRWALNFNRMNFLFTLKKKSIVYVFIYIHYKQLSVGIRKIYE